MISSIGFGFGVNRGSGVPGSRWMVALSCTLRHEHPKRADSEHLVSGHQALRTPET